jgi:nitrogen regulatory protein P-II 1
MTMRKVTAIFRQSMLENVEKALQEHGIHGFSISSVRGCGEYTNFYTKDLTTSHSRIEIFVKMDKAQDIAETIMHAAHIGQPGDGIVAILPVEKLYHIRTKSETVD